MRPSAKILILALTLAVIPTQPSCAAIQKAEAIAVDCGPGALIATITELVPVVADLLSSNEVGVLDDLGKVFGPAFTCAVGVIAQQGGAASQSTAATINLTVIEVPKPIVPSAVVNAVEYIHIHNITYKVIVPVKIVLRVPVIR